MLRDTVRALAEAKIAPYAAAVDEEARFPQEALRALVSCDLHAVHVPESYGGAGADALATVIVIEEVARVCASSSLIPAVNKLGSLPLILSGSEDLKKKYLSCLAKGDVMFSYCLSEPDAGSDAAGMKTKAVRDGDSYVLNGVKRWITNAGESEYYTVMAVTDPAKRSKGISAFVVESAREQAVDVLLNQSIFDLTADQAAAFERILDHPPTPTDKLKALMKGKSPWEP